MNGFEVNQSISVHTHEYGVVSGIITKVLENMIIIQTKEDYTIKVLI